MLQMQRGRCCRGVAVHCHANMHVVASTCMWVLPAVRNHVDQIREFQLRQYRENLTKPVTPAVTGPGSGWPRPRGPARGPATVTIGLGLGLGPGTVTVMVMTTGDG